MAKIEAELVKATGVKQKAKEDQQDYFARLIEKTQDLENDEWDKLSNKAQSWVNAGAKVQNAEKGDEIPNFADADNSGDDAEDDKDDKKPAKKGKAAKDEEADDDKEDKKPARGSKAKKDEEVDDEPKGRRRPAKDEGDDGADDAPKARGKKDAPDKKAAAPDKKPVKDKPAKKGGEGAQASIKRAIIKDPTATTEDIIAALAKKGLDATTSAVSTIRSGTLQTLRLVKELGVPKGEF